MGVERLVKHVTHGPVKTVLIAFLALMLAMSHAACACLSQNAGATHAVGHDMHGAHTETGRQSHNVSGAHHDHNEQAEPCKSGGGDCEHCASSALYKASVKGDVLASIGFAPVAKIIVADVVAAVTHGGSRTTKLVAFLWRGPPIATPVSLKIRLLI
ncbi:MAG: hypothetical protein AAF936_03530 [Pseudomonadota bacterium]